MSSNEILLRFEENELEKIKKVARIKKKTIEEFIKEEVNFSAQYYLRAFKTL